MARTIALVGGGTMGPTAPLLAVQRVLLERHPRDRFVWVGTEDGPERGPVTKQGIKFISIPMAKLTRYFSLTWFSFPWDYAEARRAAREFLDEWKPDIVIGAGGFTQVPIMREAWKRKIPCIIHQLDFYPTLSNRLVARFCKLITTTFVYHYNKFRARIEEKHIATPNRFADVEPPERLKAAQTFKLDNSRPIIFVTGGGTGSAALNKTIEDNLDKWLAKTQIIHVTGRGRSDQLPERPGYVRRDFLDERGMLNAYAAADLVVSRAGMGAITDLATMNKAAILVPIPHSHQEKNTRHLPLGIVEVQQSKTFFDDLFRAVAKLLKHKEDRARLAYELHRIISTDNGSEWASLIERFLPEDLD